MARTALLFLGIVAWVAACSPSLDLPPDLTCDGGCPIVIGLAGSNGTGGDDAGGTCAPEVGDTPCDSCAKASCCQTFSGCFSSTECGDLSSCEASCGDDATCISGCQGQYPSGVSGLNELDSCLESLCSVCSQSGVGDPCGANGGVCQTGLTCNGTWCTETCAGATGCAGLGPGGENSFGNLNACVGTATNGSICFPGCGSLNDCGSFPGTQCVDVLTVDGVMSPVCKSPPDAGTD